MRASAAVLLLSFSLGAAAGTRGPEFVVPNNATQIDTRSDRGVVYVSFAAPIDFPAASYLQQVARTLSGLGWRPLRESVLNPGIPSDYVRGWQEFGDHTRVPPLTVHQWLTEWRDRNGDIIEYALTYSYPENGHPQLSRAKIVILRTPAAVMRAVVSRSVSVARWNRLPSLEIESGSPNTAQSGRR